MLLIKVNGVFIKEIEDSELFKSLVKNDFDYLKTIASDLLIVIKEIPSGKFVVNNLFSNKDNYLTSADFLKLIQSDKIDDKELIFEDFLQCRTYIKYFLESFTKSKDYSILNLVEVGDSRKIKEWLKTNTPSK